jgi:DNA-binding SARP family transcriptional activator/tetratricopeptide (TPR) repeat protein/energy-coupling factor transporter ATP-binding protein EcfA2
LRINILGPVRLRVHDQVDLGAIKVRGLLGYLSFRVNEPVHVDRIAEALWDDDRPPNPAKVLQTYVSRLRRVFRESGCAADLRHEHHSYRLHIDQSTVDYHEFRSIVRSGHRARGRGNHREAAELFTVALHMWAGTPLADLDTTWARRLRETLTNRELIPTYYALFDTELTLGEHDFVLNTLPSLLADHVHDEGIAVRWIRALTAANRGDEVPAFYREFTQRLRDDLDTPPSPELTQVAQEAARPRAGAKPGLPRATPYFTGRGELLYELDSLLSDGRDGDVVALDGPPGVGKTTLVKHWARLRHERFADAVLYIDLAGYSGAPLVEPHTAAAMLLDELGVAPSRIPHGTDERVALLRHTLSTRDVLVILDNARDSAHVRPLLAATSGCPTLITSRRQLTGIAYHDGVRRLAVPPMSSDDAMALLRKRIGGRVADAPAAIGELVDLCQCLPLALRIAGEHISVRPAVPLAELAEELRHTKRLLDAGSQGDDHTTTLRAAFSWSYQALRPDERHVFELLGLHPSTRFSTQVAGALLGTAENVEHLLDSLVGAHLIAQERAGRYAVHDLLHAYARTISSEHEPRAVRRMLDWYLRSAQHARVRLTGDDQAVPELAFADPVSPADFADSDAALKWLVAERTNLVACTYRAAESGHHDHAWRFAACLNVLSRYESPRNLLAIHEIGRQSAELTGNVAAVGGCLNNKGTVHALLNDHAEAARCFELAYEAFAEISDERGVSVTTHNIGVTKLSLHRPAEAIEWLTRALIMNTRLGSEWALANSHRRLGDAYRMLGNGLEARSQYRKASYSSQKAGDVIGHGASLSRLAKLSAEQDRADEAIQYGQAALEIFDRVHIDRNDTAATLTTLATAHLHRDSPGTARSMAEEAVHAYRETQNVDGQIDALVLLGRAFAASGEPARAADAWASAGALITSPTDPRLDRLRVLLHIPSDQSIPPPRIGTVFDGETRESGTAVQPDSPAAH